MIELYSLHWSHYVEKVRWALDYKQLEYRIVPVSVPQKPEMAHLECAGLESASAGRVLTVPTIFDSSTGTCVTDSTEIIRYLEDTFPGSAKLLPGTPDQQEEMRRWMRYLDSELGLPARRLGYTQLILEAPEILPELFLDKAPGWLKLPIVRQAAAVVLSGLLIQRFRFLRIRKDRVFESLFAVLRRVTARLGREEYLAGREFSAADLTLASLLRPLRIVPAVRDAPEFASLFSWQEGMFRRHDRESELLYETRIRERREQCGWSAGNIRWLCQIPSDGPVNDDTPASDKSRNDQHAISRLRLASAWVDYFRLRHFSGYSRRRWPLSRRDDL